MRIKGSAGKGIFPPADFPTFFLSFLPILFVVPFPDCDNGQKRICHRTRHAIQKKKAGEMPESGVKTKKYANELYPQKTTQQSLEEQPKTTNKCQQRLSWKKLYNFFVVRKLN